MPTVTSKRRKSVRPRDPLPDPVTPEMIRALRIGLELTIDEAAGKVGVKPSTWYGWETPSQKRRPSPSHLILIRLLAADKL